MLVLAPEAGEGAEKLPASPKGFLQKLCVSGSGLKTPSTPLQKALQKAGKKKRKKLLTGADPYAILTFVDSAER